MLEEIEKIVYSEEEIRERVKAVGKQITEDYKGKSPLFVGILKGSVVFMADLMRAVELPCEIDFMVAQSYGDAAVSSGNVQIKYDLSTNIAGRDVIIVEDVLDSARTLYHVKKILQVRNPASIRICTFLDKKVERAVDVTADYRCFYIDNEFAVGYGLDYAQKYRNLPYVGVLKPEVYSK